MLVRACLDFLLSTAEAALQGKLPLCRNTNIIKNLQCTR